MYDMIAVIVIPFLVTLLKKIKLPSKFAPIAAFIIALVIVAGGKVLGYDLNVTTIAEAIVKALAIAGVSVLGYDTVKKLTETPTA
mgnify:CR=1 FL=1